MRAVILVGVAALCVFFLVLSFHPRARFAHPVTEHFPRAALDFHCYHDVLYERPGARDALFFGTSRTMFAFSPDRVEEAFRAVTGRSVEVFEFSTTWHNPELAYFAFRDYLRNNPAPGSAFFQLTPPLPMEEPVRYVNPLFPFLAPPYLYLRELRSWEFVESPLFALSDTLRLLLRHVDLSLSNLLVHDRYFLVPRADNCSLRQSEQGQASPGMPAGEFEAAASFDALLAAESEKLLPPGGWDKAGDFTILTERYADNPAIVRRLDLLGPDWSRWKPRALFGRSPVKARPFGYFKQILALGAAHGVDVAFYIVPAVYQPAPTEQQLASLSGELGAPVHIIPFKYARVAYHHYRDPIHVLPEAVDLMSAWAASMISVGEPD